MSFSQSVHHTVKSQIKELLKIHWGSSPSGKTLWSLAIYEVRAAPNTELCQQGSISLPFLHHSELQPFYDFPDCEQSVQGRAQCLETTWAFRSEKAAVWLYILCKSLIPLCCVAQWAILTTLLFLSVNFTEERNSRERGQHVHPARCLSSS